MAHLGMLVALLGAVAIILRECGVFESLRQRNVSKPPPKKKRKPEKIYDHKYQGDE